MGFGDLKTDAGLKELEQFLTNESYIEGHEPSQADVTVYKAVSVAPSGEKYPHSARWYKHIASFESTHDSLPGDASKPHTAYGGVSAAVAGGEDDIDLFASDEDEVDEEAEKVKAQRLEEYKKKKEAKGPKPPAKSIVTLDIKPWDDETNLDELEKEVRAIEMDGLLWGLSKREPVGYGIFLVRINLVVEDDKVSLDELQERVQEIEDYVQSSDIAAMQKI